MEKRRLYSAVEEWMTEYKKNSVKAATYDRLCISRKLMSKYRIANQPVDEIKAIDIQRYLNELVSDGYTVSTIKKQLNLITAYMKHAFSQGDISSPVYLSVKLPSVESVKVAPKTIEAYSPIEQRRLTKIFSSLDKPAYAALSLMLEAGLRVGEVLSLTWNDIDWTRRAVRVGKTLVRLSSSPTTFVQSSPKSKSSARTIPLSTTAMDILGRLSEMEDTRGYVFYMKDDPYTPESYSSLIFHTRRACKEAGVEYKGLHVFRHTFASNCYGRGCDVKILSKLLGHADVAITYNTYIHLFGDALEEMRKVLG